MKGTRKIYTTREHWTCILFRVLPSLVLADNKCILSCAIFPIGANSPLNENRRIKHSGVYTSIVFCLFIVCFVALLDKLPDKFITFKQIMYPRRRHCQVFAGRDYKNVCNTTKCYDNTHIP